MNTMDYEDMAAEAASDAMETTYEALIREEIGSMSEETMLAIGELEASLPPEDMPHPWTWHRHLLSILKDEGEDSLLELLDELYRGEAEETVEDNYEPGPCCNDFSCPCGNSNNYPG